MVKKKLLVFGLCVFIFGLSVNAQAATNPDLAALLQAKVVQFTGTEHISRPFAFDIEIIVPNPALKFANIVGQPLKLTVAPSKTVAGMVGSI